MRSIPYVDRLWQASGALAALILLAIGWFFLVGPQYSEAQALQDQAADAEARVVLQTQRLAELQNLNKRLAEFKAKLAVDRRALPTDSGMPDFLRQLQAAGARTGVTISSLIVGDPAQVPGASRDTYSFPLSITAAGGAAKVASFVEVLQRVQPRAVLVNSVNSTADNPLDPGGRVELSLSLVTFMTPVAAASTGP